MNYQVLYDSICTKAKILQIECPHCHRLGYFSDNHFVYCECNPNALKKEEIKCPNCNKIGTNKHNMINYHFDNCPSINSTLTGSRLKISMTKNNNNI